jgi:thiamine pyrophosphokinase
MNNVQRRAVVMSGGRLGAWALQEILPDDILIGADRGALFLIQHGLRPDLAIGDFDSVTVEELALIRQNALEFHSCDAINKDESDTEIAFEYALRLKPAEIVLIGALGTRFDHSLANIHLLHKAHSLGIMCRIVDEFNIICLTDSTIEVVRARGFSHVSLLPLTLEVSGVTIEGFQYPLNEATLTMGQSLAISNVLDAKAGYVHIRAGVLLVIQSKD